MRKTKMKIKGLTAVLILTFVLICACGKEQGKKMEAANSTSVETQVTSALPSEAPVISTSPTETDPPKAAPVKVKDLKLNNKVTIQVSIGAKACCLRKITANKKCTKIIKLEFQME